MNLGASQINITPLPGVELSGFAARAQPSIGVLDPLLAKALYLTDTETRLLWVHCDLVGFDRSIVLDFRRWAGAQFGLHEGQVMLSATHTHSGPCTIHLQECGRYDAAYVEFLQTCMREAAQAAMRVTEPMEAVAVEGNLTLAIDRRKTASAHTDPRVGAIGFRRRNGRFAAVVVNYAMHPVGLGSSNRQISADVPGQTALALAQLLPGEPVVLVTNGACANLNPPAEDVPCPQVEAWGRQIAKAVAPLLESALPISASRLRLLTRVIPLPIDALDAQGINASAKTALKDANSLAQWGDKYRRVVEHWRSSLLASGLAGLSVGHRDAELFGVCLGTVVLLGANAEVFSEFTDWVRPHIDKKLYLIGYANGDIGYLPTRAAYEEGGYEVNVAHLFYGGFRPRQGSLELLASAAADMLACFQTESCVGR